MRTGTDKWEERYRQPGYWTGTEPAGFLQEVFALLPRGAALDLAMGEGRNAVFLAARGWRVMGIDRSAAALEKAEALACEHGVRAARALPRPPTQDAGPPLALPALSAAEGSPSSRASGIGPEGWRAGLLLVCADLETCPLPVAQFDVVLCFNYLQRSLFPAMEAALRSGGALVYETYTLDQLQYGKGPQNPEYLLRPGELREAFAGLETIFYSELSAGKGMAGLLARKR